MSNGHTPPVSAHLETSGPHLAATSTRLAAAASIILAWSGCAVPEHGNIVAVLRTQSECWNRGDIDGFMKYYERGDDLTFSSGGKTTRGWQSTLQRYHDRYPDRTDMGTLRFSDLEITPLGADHALVLGRWHLQRDVGDIGGNFSLVMRREHGGWRIIHDHTSMTPKPESKAAAPAGT